MSLPPDLLAVLVCPKCRGALEVRGGGPEALRCGACQVDYPVRDGIPILIVDDAVPVGPVRA